MPRENLFFGYNKNRNVFKMRFLGLFKKGFVGVYFKIK
jgi:hypothetical protein